MVVRIVENVDRFNEEEYSSFLQDYKYSNLTVIDIQKKYGLTRKEYHTYRDAVYNRTGFTRKNKGKSQSHPAKCYYYDKCAGKYFVRKCIKGKNVYFGKYETKEIARKIVEELNKIGWDKTQLEQIKIGLGV